MIIMDGQPKTANRPLSGIPRPASGIPRPTSRLPLPTSTAPKSIKPSPSRDRLRADPGIDEKRLRRPSYDTLVKKTSSRFLEPPKHKDEPVLAPKQDETQGGEDDTHVSEEVSSAAGDDDTASIASTQEVRGRRGVRPSLSERTLETLAQIPPSPASVKRQSSFFNGASPIRSPSRAPSNVSSVSRSPSRASSCATNSNETYTQPVSKLRLPSSNSRMSATSSLSPVRASEESLSPSRLKQPSAQQSIVIGDGARSDINSPPKKTFPERSIGGKETGRLSLARPSPSKQPAKPMTKSTKSNMGPPERPLQVRKTRKVGTEQASTLRSPSTTSRYVSASSNTQEELSPEQQAESEARKASKSSSTLRETIAKAKAARKAAAEGEKKENPQKPVAEIQPADSWGSVEAEDPFNQLPKGSTSLVMRKRVQTARATGQLNIAAFSLTEIPKEVLTMYDYDPDNANWFENVDLVKFIAADNELEQISDEIFPDINSEEFDQDSDDRGLQFGGLETLDLHGNILKSLPMGLRRLQNLRTLNLSNNSLDMDHIEIITEIESLTDLKLANNQLQGELATVIGRLDKLEFLDLRGNKLTKLPEELVGLSSLRSLDVSENKLTSLPFELLSKLPLKTLNAQKNKLEGTLIPASVDGWDTLQSLNIANNAVTVFSPNDTLDLPNLHTLLIGVNRITHLPCVSSWQALLTLSAEENKIVELPSGFVELKSLKKADFTGNDITRLDDKMGLMESLTSFKVASNPLRERRFLKMDTEDIKRDLRSRCEPDPLDTDDEGSVATQFTLAPENPTLDGSWQIKSGGTLDKSFSEMADLTVEQLEMVASQDIRCLHLQHNQFSCFPAPALKMLTQSLVELDLSHNPMKGAEFLSTPLELPKLQSLTLNATSMTSWEPLLANLVAPSLTFLDVSYNRLKGPLPNLRSSYPELKTILASDNQIASLDFESVQGLQVVELSNNDIDSLPPKIGLLAANRDPHNWGTGSALRRFEVAGNRFRVPRWQVVAKGTDAILDFLRDRIPYNDLPEWEKENEASEEEF